MRIVLTGGGSGGHFTPIIAVAQEIHNITNEKKLLQPELYYIGPEPYDQSALTENNIIFKKSSAGKVRRYFSLLNFVDFFKNIFGIFSALVQLFSLYPDVVFSKGGYASFPTVVAARLLRIPVIVHESDSKPGRVNAWTAPFAKFVAVSYPDMADQFKKVAKEKIARTGLPVRKSIFSLAHEGGYEFLNLSPDIPTIFVMGGSQGAQVINEVLLTALPKILDDYQVIHQTGIKNEKSVADLASVILKDHPHKDRYRAFGFLNTLALRMSAGIASLVISRGGSTAIFEIAAWGIPSIIIPIPDTVSHDQVTNAFTYSRTGAAIVIKQGNLTANILTTEINRIIENPDIQEKMVAAAQAFSEPEAAKKIATIIINTALEHEI